MRDIAPCPHCNEPRPYDLRGSCRVCGTKIAPNASAPPVRLDIPRTWGELWPTLLVSGFLLAAGVGLCLAAFYVHEPHHYRNGKLAALLGFFGVGLVVCAAKCWTK